MYTFGMKLEPSSLSTALFKIDPLGTLCNHFDGMEDEYDAISECIVKLVEEGVPISTAVNDTLTYYSGENITLTGGELDMLCR